MPQGPDWKQYLDAGVEFTEVTRAQARRRAEQLVREGKLARERVQAFVDDLVALSRRRTEQVAELVRREVARQVKVLGIATKDDLAALEARLAGTAKKAAASTSRKKAPAKKASATKAPAGKAAPSGPSA